MQEDIRLEAAKYYDLNPSPPDDVSFYLRRVPSPNARVLELGCGTGRVTLLLSRGCGFIRGIDRSQAMLSVCREKIEQLQIPASKVRVERGDITNLDLEETFDWIIAPFRVFQNLETDEQVNGLFNTVRRHLAPGGTCILNVFMPYKDREGLIEDWVSLEENLSWEVDYEDGRVTCHDRRPQMDPESLVLYPELIYRRYRGDVLMDEAVLKIAMRCYYPDEFESLVKAHGFQILNRWGGYAGEVYGEGPELILEFKQRSQNLLDR
jgi:SAM-dependent methyltransferase